MQSLVTGQFAVGLDFFPEKPAAYVGAEIRYVEIPTIQTSLQALSKTIEKLPVDELANKLVLSIEGIEKFINSPDLREAAEVPLSASLHDEHGNLRLVMNDSIGNAAKYCGCESTSALGTHNNEIYL